MSNYRGKTGWPVIVGVAGIAAAIGFGVARSLPAPAPAPSAEAGEAQAPRAASGEVTIPEAYLASADIGVEAVVAGDVRSEILAPAVVGALPGGEAVIVARASGALTRVTRSLGDAVRAGEVIAQVDSLEAATMAADRRVARARAEQARTVYEREASLFQQGVSPRQEMEAAKASLDVAEAESQRAVAVARGAHVSDDGRTVSIVSPIAGRITRLSATLGGFVSPDAELFRVAASGAVQVEAAVSAADAGRIAVGDSATILLRNGTPVAATVRSVTPTVNTASRTATALLTPQSATPQLVIGEGVQVRLHSRAGPQAGLTVPEEAVQNLDGRDVLFVRTEQGFKARPVRVGIRSGGSAQILSGASAGDRVATRNAFLVKAESQKSAGDEE